VARLFPARRLPSPTVPPCNATQPKGPYLAESPK
jgi:hypothetical protein